MTPSIALPPWPPRTDAQWCEWAAPMLRYLAEAPRLVDDLYLWGRHQSVPRLTSNRVRRILSWIVLPRCPTPVEAIWLDPVKGCWVQVISGEDGQPRPSRTFWFAGDVRRILGTRGPDVDERPGLLRSSLAAFDYA